jgi:NDP-sugar pyrophosphorylase family protein
MKAVILAGGLGTRLRPFTEAIPKPLLPIGEKSVLEIQIEQLKKCGFEEIFLATNYKSDYIENFLGDGTSYGVKLKISKEKKPLGTVGPLSLLENEFSEPFLVMNGDILTLMSYNELYDFACLKNSLLTVSIKEFITPFQFGNIFYEGDYITKIEEKPNFKTNILAGIYVFKPGIFEIIPKDVYYSMDTLINDMIKKNSPITKFVINDYWLDIGRDVDYQKAQEIYKDYFINEK